MHAILNSNLDINTIAEDPMMIDFINKYFPEVYKPKNNKPFTSRTAFAAGKVCGSFKNFFSKTETKAATLLAYWAADTIVAAFLLLTTTNLFAITLAASMLALHTYATFSVVTELMKQKVFMLIFSDEVKSHINDVELELYAIQHSFAKTVEEQPNSYKPFAIFFSDPQTKLIALASRDVQDEIDYFTAISEMLFSFTSLEAQAVMLAIDATKTTETYSQDLLEVYVACDHFCVVYNLPYDKSEDNKIIWLEDKFATYTIDKLEKVYDTSGDLRATLEIIEALYLHTHLNARLFDQARMISFLKNNGYDYHIFDPKETKEQTSI